MISNVPNAKDLEQISSEFRLGKFLQLLNPDLKSPLVSIYIAIIKLKLMMTLLIIVIYVINMILKDPKIQNKFVKD